MILHNTENLKTSTTILLEYNQSMATSDIGIRILVEHTQQPLLRASTYRKSICSTDSFNSSYKNISGSFSGEASFGFGLCSGSVSAAFNHVASSVASLKTLTYLEESSMTEFNPNFLQIIREVTTEVIIDGNVAKTVESKIVDAVVIDNPLSQKHLQKRSEEFIKLYDHDGGTGSGIKIGSICTFSATEQLKLKGKGIPFMDCNCYL